MILNPVIQGGGAEKVYKITNTTQIGFPTSATAGSFVYGYGDPGQTIDIHGDTYRPRIPSAVPYGLLSYPIRRICQEATGHLFVRYACIGRHCRVIFRKAVAV